MINKHTHTHTHKYTHTHPILCRLRQRQRLFQAVTFAKDACAGTHGKGRVPFAGVDLRVVRRRACKFGTYLNGVDCTHTHYMHYQSPLHVRCFFRSFAPISHPYTNTHTHTHTHTHTRIHFHALFLALCSFLMHQFPTHICTTSFFSIRIFISFVLSSIHSFFRSILLFLFSCFACFLQSNKHPKKKSHLATSPCPAGPSCL